MESREIKNQSQDDLNQFKQMEEYFNSEKIPVVERLDAFPKYCSRQSMAKFLTKYELFKKILNINGSIVECGVLHGAGLLTWAKLSSILEPVNHTRKIFGFDTFSGFPDIDKKDSGTFSGLVAGGLVGSTLDSVQAAIKLYNANRPLKHIDKVKVVPGDFCKTGKKFLKDNPQLVISLLYLDFDLYKPTKAALELFLPRIPKGGIIVFDELNAEIFPGETAAVNEIIGLKNIKIERFSFDSYVSYAVL